MAPIILLIVLSFLFTPTSTQIQSNEEGFISVTISEKGLDFAKDVLIDKAISSIIPLQLPDIEKFVKIPLVGKVYMLLSNITIFRVDIASSYVNTGETGIVLVASGATANLSMSWQYSYHTWLVPIAITDDGDASVQVEGMEVGVIASLKNQEGNLKLSVLECGCHVKYISINVNGGASWLYQGTQIQSNDEGFISVTISEKGLDFAKDVLIDKAISSIIPLQLPDIEKFVKIPLVGKVYMLLSNITIFHVDIASSYVNTGETGIVLVASGATANLSMNWLYSYRTWLVPIAITDDGDASVQVEGMEVGVTASLKNQEGNLKLSVLECGCHVKYISIKVNGGASWLYQGVVDAFEKKIATAVENAISKKIREGIIKLDSSLQSIPKQVPVYSIAVLNVTFVDNPVMSNTSIEFEINGLVTAKDAFVVSNYNHKGWKGSSSCSSPAKMIQISLQETFFNSISLVYFDEDYMHWIFDNVTDQSILNTAGWRYIVPQLYEKYPNDDMNLNISVSSPPIIKVAKDDINAFVNLDVTIDVIDSDEVIPAACISLEISTSGSAEILRNNLAGSVRLKDFSMYLKWSEIGDLQMHLLQPVMSTILKTVFLPYVNLHLRRGFPLPILHGFTLQDAEIVYTDSTVIVYSDLASTKQYLYAAM